MSTPLRAFLGGPPERQPLNEDDLVEAFDIVAGTTMRLPERRHLVALAHAWDDAVAVAARFGGQHLADLLTPTVPTPRKES